MAAFFAASVVLARAWGPHGAITRAALDAVNTNHAAIASLGDHAILLTNHCWMADYKRLPYKDGDVFVYADDYLLFQGMTTHPSHICPEVRQTYRPFFRRALQALRMESPANAARWLGSLLHFVEDTGSPPHAAEISGGLHIKMENWVDAARIEIPDYEPAVLGTTAGSAEEAFMQRMEGLIAYSKTRGLKLRTPVLIGNRRAAEPVVLESALETARVTADLMATLAYLAGRESADSSTGHLEGTVASEPLPEVEPIPARILVAGTDVSTLADLQGRFVLRGLPAGEHELVVLRPSCGVAKRTVRIEAGTTNRLTVSLADPTRNLIRNGTFDLRWLHDARPDFWYRTELGWEGEVIPLQTGRRYRLYARFKEGIDAEIVLRWSRRVPWETAITSPLPPIQSRPLKPDEPSMEFEGTDAMGLVQVTLKTPRGMATWEACESVVLAPVDGGQGAGGREQER